MLIRSLQGPRGMLGYLHWQYASATYLVTHMVIKAPVAPKAATKTPAATVAPVLAGPVQVPTQPNVPQLLNVKAGLYYRGARAAWYAVLQAHNGQPANAYLAACLANPPSLPKSLRPEAPTGWLRYFVRVGTCTLGQVAPPATKV